MGDFLRFLLIFPVFDAFLDITQPIVNLTGIPKMETAGRTSFSPAFFVRFLLLPHAG